MAVYSGYLCYKGDLNKPTGLTRKIYRATDDILLAKVFGKRFTKSQLRNNKTRMVDLFLSQKPMVYVDVREVKKINDLTFLTKNVKKITNWKALGNYMMINHASYLNEIYKSITQEPMHHPSNEMVIELCKCLLGVGNPSNVRAIYLKEMNNTNIRNIKYVDSVGRFLMSQVKYFHFKENGVNYHGMLVIKHYKCRPQKRDINITYQLKDFDVFGSKKAIVNVHDKMYEKKQFQTLKKDAQEFSGSTFEFNCGINGLTIAQIYQIGINQSVMPKIIRHVKNVEPSKAGLNFFTKFNAATVYDELWKDWKFSRKDIPQKGIKERDLRLYNNGKISPNELLQKYSPLFVEKIHNTMKKQYITYASKEAFATIALQELGERRVNKREVVKIAGDVLKHYYEALSEITDLSQLMLQYCASQKEHNDEIVKNIKKCLASKRYHQKEEIDEASKLFNKEFIQLVTDYWQVYLRLHSTEKSLLVDQNLDEKFIAENMLRKWEHFKSLIPVDEVLKNPQETINNYLKGIRPEFSLFIKTQQPATPAKKYSHSIARQSFNLKSKLQLSLERSISASFDFKGPAIGIMREPIRSLIKRCCDLFNTIEQEKPEWNLDAKIQLTTVQMGEEMKKIFADGTTQTIEKIAKQCMQLSKDQTINEKGITSFLKERFPGNQVLYDNTPISDILDNYLKCCQNGEINNIAALESTIIEGFNNYLKDAGITIREFTLRTGTSLTTVVGETSRRIKTNWQQLVLRNNGIDVAERLRTETSFQDRYFSQYLEKFEDEKLSFINCSKIEEKIVEILDSHFITQYMFVKSTGQTPEEIATEIVKQFGPLDEVSLESVETLLGPFLRQCEEYSAEYVKDIIREQYGEISNINNVECYPLDNNRIVCNSLTIEEYITDHFPMIS